jgi:hypothetical protein
MNTTAKKIGLLSAGIVLSLNALQVSAAVVGLSPPIQQASNGETLTFDLSITGLGDFAPESLGAFELDVNYDPTRLSFLSYSLGTLLGDTDLDEAIDGSVGDPEAVGAVNLVEISLLDTADLIDLQPSSFLLATLDFFVDYLPAGASTTLAPDNVTILNAQADPSPIDLTGTIDAVVAGSQVPAPGVLSLMALGLAGIAWQRYPGNKIR